MKTVCIYHSIDLDEQWKIIPNSKYEVSNKGNIRSLDMTLLCKHNTYRVRKGIMLKQSFDKNGYLRVAIHGVTKKSHRLVAEAFIPNPNNLPEINHIDGNKTNNNVTNLEWCNRQDNLVHSIKHFLQPTSETSNCSIPVIQYTKTNIFVKEYFSARDARLS